MQTTIIRIVEECKDVNALVFKYQIMRSGDNTYSGDGRDSIVYASPDISQHYSIRISMYTHSHTIGRLVSKIPRQALSQHSTDIFSCMNYGYP